MSPLMKQLGTQVHPELKKRTFRPGPSGAWRRAIPTRPQIALRSLFYMNGLLTRKKASV